MKIICFLAIIAVMITAGCSSDVEIELVDTSELNETIEQLADNYLNAWNNKNLDALIVLAADDGQFYGSDPSEIMDKAALIDMYTLFFSDSTTAYLYTVDMRKIRLAPEGKSAIVMERITFPEWSPKMPMCQTSQFVKKGDNWEIDFICWGFIAKNEDVVKLNKVLE